MAFFGLFKNEILTETIEVNDKQFLVKVHYENRAGSRASIGKKSINIRFVGESVEYLELIFRL